jgi:NYN domain-containing protein/OST-HTH/LOTUS domain-containing protein
VAAADNIRIAVLIDADNTSPKHAEALLEEVAKYGVPTVKRAYGDWTNSHLNGWRSELPKYAVQPMLQIANTTGKNSTDSALIIDAMDLLYSGNVDAFALVSSDSDFTSLAIRLRGSGRTVYGMGLRKTPQSLRQAVDRFIFLEDLHEGGAAEEPAPAEEATEPRRIPDLRRLLERAVNGTAHDDGWASLSSVANHVTRVEPSFSVKDYGAAKLVDLVRAQDYLEVEQPADGGSVRVRLTTGRPSRSGAVKKTAAKKTTTRKRATKKAAAAAPEPAEAPAEFPAESPAASPAEPSPEAPAEPPAPPTVTTRKRSERTRKK